MEKMADSSSKNQFPSVWIQATFTYKREGAGPTMAPTNGWAGPLREPTNYWVPLQDKQKVQLQKAAGLKDPAAAERPPPPSV